MTCAFDHELEVIPRENLRFYGICEEGDQEACTTRLKTFTEHHLGIKWEEFAEIEFQRLHRIGKSKEDSRPSPTIARFLRYGDREFIFSKAKFLKGTEYGISDDLTAKSWNEERRKERSYLKREKLVSGLILTVQNQTNCSLMEFNALANFCKWIIIITNCDTIFFTFNVKPFHYFFLY